MSSASVPAPARETDEVGGGEQLADPVAEGDKHGLHRLARR